MTVVMKTRLTLNRKPPPGRLGSDGASLGLTMGRDRAGTGVHVSHQRLDRVNLGVEALVPAPERTLRQAVSCRAHVPALIPVRVQSCQRRRDHFRLTRVQEDAGLAVVDEVTRVT